MTIDQAIEAIYTSLDNDNDDIDTHIAALKTAMIKAELTEAVFQSARLPINNREGRKTMQAYFKKRGIKVSFEK
jgi:hypothetical protein